MALINCKQMSKYYNCYNSAISQASNMTICMEVDMKKLQVIKILYKKYLR